VSVQQHAPTALYSRERTGTHCTGGRVGPRTGLDVRKISSAPGFFLSVSFIQLFVSVTVLHVFVRLCFRELGALGFVVRDFLSCIYRWDLFVPFHWRGVGGLCPPHICSPVMVLSCMGRCFVIFFPHRDSIPDRPARSQSLYQLSYPAHISRTFLTKHFSHTKYQQTSTLITWYSIIEFKVYRPSNKIVLSYYEINGTHIAHLRQECHNSKFGIFLVNGNISGTHFC